MPREAPPQNTIYTGMLAVSLGAMAVACLVLAMHMNAYDWTMTPPPGPPVSLPPKTAPAGPAGGGQGAALPAKPNTPALAATTPVETREPGAVPPPVTLPSSP